MADSTLRKVEVIVDNAFSCSFEAIKNNTEKGVLFTEKNFAKENRELYALALLPDKKLVVLQAGNFCLTFEVKNGNLEDFEGKYEITFIEHTGIVTVE